MDINARTVSDRLHCSTQPVMYHFATIEEIKFQMLRRSEKPDDAGLLCVFLYDLWR